MKKFIAVESLNELHLGDIVRGRLTKRVYIVTANYGSYVTAVASQDISQPNEWTVLRELPEKER